MVGPPREFTDGSDYNCIYLFNSISPPKVSAGPRELTGSQITHYCLEGGGKEIYTRTVVQLRRYTIVRFSTYLRKGAQVVSNNSLAPVTEYLILSNLSALITSLIHCLKDGGFIAFQFARIRRRASNEAKATAFF